uniref:Uncharacterized protein n=1 Tax=Anguilla anguilla TaxID=7936 RepID=A0A0E9XFJ2_ANGAN
MLPALLHSAAIKILRQLGNFSGLTGYFPA